MRVCWYGPIWVQWKWTLNVSVLIGSIQITLLNFILSSHETLSPSLPHFLAQKRQPFRASIFFQRVQPHFRVAAVERSSILFGRADCELRSNRAHTHIRAQDSTCPKVQLTTLFVMNPIKQDYVHWMCNMTNGKLKPSATNWSISFRCQHILVRLQLHTWV